MFTGLVEEVGSVFAIHRTQLEIAAPRLAKGIRIGDSVAVDGCCLTLSARDGDRLVFDILGETFDRTNLKTLRRDTPVNLERALAADGRIGGHFVQGHIDCAAQIMSFEQTGNDDRLEIELAAQFARYVLRKGSIALNGISFTIAEVFPESFAVWVIPHTKQQTNLASAKPGDLINVEFDILAKYVERMLLSYAPPP